MGEQERDWDGPSDEHEDPPTESPPQKDDSKEEDYLRPHLPRDVFGSQIGPAIQPAAASASGAAIESADGLIDNEALETIPPPEPGRMPFVPRQLRTRDLPRPDAVTKREIESAIVQLRQASMGPVPEPDAEEEVEAAEAAALSATAPSTDDLIEMEDYGSSSTGWRSMPAPPARVDSTAWLEWRPPHLDPLDAPEMTRVETPPMRPGAAQPRATDYLVLHPFPFRILACLFTVALVVAAPWIAGQVLAETVYYPALDVVSEVWFKEFGLYPAGAAVLLALWILARRHRYWRYEFGYVLVAVLCAVVAVSAAAISLYVEPSARGRYLLPIWGGLMGLGPLLFSLGVNMDPAWVVGRRRYWKGVVWALVPTFLAVCLMAGAVGAVHKAHGEWRQFMDPANAEFCRNLLASDGFRPGPLAMAVLGRRRDSRLPTRAATCVQTQIAAPWSGERGRRAVPLSKATVQATADTLAAPWRDNPKNSRVAGTWVSRKERLEALFGFIESLPASTRATYESRLRAKGPTRVACSNPFRAPEATLWRAAGHPDCGKPLERDALIKNAVAWLSFMGSKPAFADPMLNDLRGEEGRDFRKLLQEVSHAAKSDELRTNDVTLIAPTEEGLDRLMITRVSPNARKQAGRQKLYLIAFAAEPLEEEVFRIIRDEWGTGSRLRCTLKPELRRSAPNGSYRIYTLRDRDDGFVVVRKWVRGEPQREYYEIQLAADPC